MKNSKFLTLKNRDFLHGLFMTVGGTIATLVYKAIIINTFPDSWLDWKTILLAGLGSGLLYLTKKLFNNTDGDFGKEKEITKW